MEAREPIRVTIDEDILELVPGFLNNRREDLKTIRASLAAGDWETVQRLSHSMKGAGGGYGFQRITEIGGAMEAAAKAADSARIEAGLADLENYLDRVEVVGE